MTPLPLLMLVAMGCFPSRLSFASGEGSGQEEAEEGIFDDAGNRNDFLNLSVVVIIVLLLLALTIAFECAKERLEEVFRKEGRHMAHILEKFWGELTVLGFLSLSTFLVTKTGLFEELDEALYHDEHDQLLELFELVHFSIFFIMIFFVLQVIVLMKGAIAIEHEWIHRDRVARRRQADGTETREFVRTVKDEAQQMEFVALREEFILERDVEPPFEPTPAAHRVSDDFCFGLYLSICLNDLLTHVVEVDTCTWIFFALMTICYYCIAVIVGEKTSVLAWMWVGVGWGVFLFNLHFERHLVHVRRSLIPAIAVDHSTRETDSTQLLGNRNLPGWCSVDLDAYLESRSWWIRYFVKGKPNRQQTLFWMDQKGRAFYLSLLRINLIFLGLYCAVLLLDFTQVMYHNLYNLFALYMSLAALPVLGIALRTQKKIAALSQVCCLGAFRRPCVVAEVRHEEHTARIVRSFIILYELSQLSERGNDLKPRPASSKRRFDELEIAEISLSFDAFDHSGDGFIDFDGFKQLMGADIDDEGLRKVMNALDEDMNGEVSKAEFLKWYAGRAGMRDGDVPLCERAKCLFSMFDTNSTGEIPVGAFKQKLDEMNSGLTIDEIGAIVHELDTDSSGAISLEEFELLIERYYPRELSDEAAGSEPNSKDGWGLRWGNRTHLCCLFRCCCCCRRETSDSDHAHSHENGHVRSPADASFPAVAEEEGRRVPDDPEYPIPFGGGSLGHPNPEQRDRREDRDRG